MSETASHRPVALVLAREEHRLSRSRISENALKVMYRLHRSGFLTCLVGGAVRDLLLDRRPKDFDVATNARPQQIRQLFRNARLIGRRFRLARVIFGEEVVEVATFRRSPEPPETEEAEGSDVLAPAAEAEEYGTPEEDAWRRDFTVNGLFYNIADFTVIDHVGGLADLERGVIRSIGPARVRFDEDPVRMMRAVEYAARLGFTIEPDTAEAIEEMRGEIRRAAPARISYELTESLIGGHATAIFQGLARRGLLDLILPEVGDDRGEMLWSLLRVADQRASSGQRLAEETLLGMFFLPGLWDAVDRVANGEAALSDLEREIAERLDPPTRRLALSNFRAHILRGAFALLPRLFAAPRSSKQTVRIIRRDAFPVAWQLAGVCATVMGAHREQFAIWEKAVQRVSAGMSPEVTAPGQVRRPGRRRPRKRGGRRRQV